MTEGYEEVPWIDDRTSEVTRHLLDLLADGEWHDREEVVQAAIHTVNPGTAIRYAQKKRYYMAKLNAKRRYGEGTEEFRAWLEEFPDALSYVSVKPADDNEAFFTGARFIVIDRINKAKRIIKRTENGVAQVRRVHYTLRAQRHMGLNPELRGGEAAPDAD